MSKKDAGRTRRSRIKIEFGASAAAVAEHLEAVAKGLRDGKFALGEDADGFEAMPSGDVELEINAERRRRRTRIDISIEFRAEALADGEAEPGDEAEPGGESETTETIPDEMTF